MPVDRRGGVDTHWVRMGHGHRKALLLHCSLGHSGGWQGVARYLDDMLDMTAFDLPGHGRSADWDGVSDLQTVSMNMALDFLDPDQPLDLIGHSFGGTIALRIAVERPELVRSLVLIEPVFFAVAMADRPDLLDMHDQDLGPYYRAMQAGELEEATRIFSGFWGDGRAWDTIPAPQRAAMVKRIRLVHAGHPQIYGDKAGILASGALDRLSHPTLLIEGGDSPPYVAAINDGLMKRLRRAERIVVDGAGHMVPITHPEEVAAQVRGFLESVPEKQPVLP
ncbi:alpha/beta hydrolase [Lutimaribacter sp. EGI FJ00015]|uniref:Alpha/beta hydrolase n=1 Tax=Lutimaribacter degradans TaxID=2945989 RepID=A0ACC5ZWE4_9RHOB|nr:alpha/beta hydrolase [Lutimaribacter sp. EGI FJ00013]MCM2562669.1 alpha/beta hydrolase [Lutimaribacter sp. EGI FJ00013]MCO0613826.1 alpha/beta hydrolase [Lutimaribacter sp. EGI FJ00015]MCO0636691.1 alpha/beta hydrolase [Lutimaribacter sp. EGI FJ00014]